MKIGLSTLHHIVIEKCEEYIQNQKYKQIMKNILNSHPNFSNYDESNINKFIALGYTNKDIRIILVEFYTTIVDLKRRDEGT